MFSGKANYPLRQVRMPEFELKLTYLELKHIPTNYSNRLYLIKYHKANLYMLFLP